MNLSDLKRAARRADTIEWNRRTRVAEVHLRIRAHRRRRAVVAVAAAMVVASLAGVILLTVGRGSAPVTPAGSLSPSPSGSVYAGDWCTAAVTPPPTDHVGFTGLPPVEALPSTTETPERVLDWFGAVYGAKADVWLFADGRLIIEIDSGFTGGPPGGIEGYVERCLAPSGMEALRRYVLQTAEVTVPAPDPLAWLHVRPLAGAPLLDLEPHSVDPRRLFEPESWLRESDWVDRRFRPYVAAKHSVCSRAAGRTPGPPASLADVPPTLADRLRQLPWALGPGSSPQTCTVLSTPEAREVVDAIERSWFAPGYDGPPAVLDVGQRRRETGNVTPGAEDRATYIAVEPVLPDGTFTCNCG